MTTRSRGRGTKWIEITIQKPHECHEPILNYTNFATQLTAIDKSSDIVQKRYVYIKKAKESTHKIKKFTVKLTFSTEFLQNGSSSAALA